MAESSDVFDQNVKHKGFFNFSDLYNFCYGWFKDEGYDLGEQEYAEKVTGAGKEIVIKWQALKKVSDYFRNKIIVKWKIIAMTDAEVEVNGRKEKTNKGDLKITVDADLQRDYEKNWEKNPSYKFFRGVYDRYIIRKNIDEYEGNLFKKCDAFVEQVKSFLNLEARK